MQLVENNILSPQTSFFYTILYLGNGCFLLNNSKRGIVNNMLGITSTINPDL